MEWNVYFHDFNRNEIDKMEFKEKLRKELMYWFWSKCEYEIVISPWVGRNKEEAEVKIDIHDQVMLNFNRFVDYCWSFKEK